MRPSKHDGSGSSDGTGSDGSGEPAGARSGGSGSEGSPADDAVEGEFKEV